MPRSAASSAALASSTLALATDAMDAFGRRIDHVEATAVRRRTPFAADLEIGGNVGDDIVDRSRLSIRHHALRIERFTVSNDPADDGQHHVFERIGGGSGMCGVVIRTGGPSRS